MNVEAFKDESSCCSIKNLTKRHLKCVCAVVFIFSFSLLVAVIITMVKLLSKHPVCLTQTCLHAAATTLSYMNSKANPCEDFYEFACGNYVKDTIIPEDESHVDLFVSVTALLFNQLKLIFHEPLSPNATKPFQIAYQLYHTCMNESSIEKEGLEKAKQFLRDLGGWPMVEGNNWNESHFEWTKFLIKLRHSGLDYAQLIKIGLELNYQNNTFYSILIDQSPPKTYATVSKNFNEKFKPAYHYYLSEIAIAFGANKATVNNETELLMEFEDKLDEMYQPESLFRNESVLYNPMSVKQLQEKFPKIDWLTYIREIIALPNINITEEEVVIVRLPDYIANILGLIDKTPKRVLANYLFSKTVLSIVPFLTQELRNKGENYFKALKITLAVPPRWKQCITVVLENVNYPVRSAYIKKYFQNEKKERAEKLVVDIKNEFAKLLNKLSWLDKSTKTYAMKKIDSMVPHVGYPQELLNDSKLEEFYSKMHVNFDSYFSAMCSIVLFNENWYFGNYRRTFNKDYWERKAIVTEVNAEYEPQENSFSVPVEILQGGFFDTKRPNYMNYGILGYIIGHEIIHGFDDTGRQYDKDGNLYNWWSENTSEIFKDKTECIIRQYNDYRYGDIEVGVDGTLTQGENIADNGGIKLSYLAYHGWIKQNGVESRLPGLDEYTPNQMFWISAAQLWCTKHRDELLNLLLSDVHAPAKFRILGPFSNSEYFSNDFKCNSTSKMNPKKKCVVW